jgi:hypothetical protein
MSHFTSFPISAAAAVTVAFVVGCDRSGVPTAPGASAEPVDGRSPAATLVPFKGTFTATGAAADIPGDRCPALTIQIQGTGTATHLGSLTTVQSHCVAPPSFDFTNGEFTLTAANGDQLSGTYEGEFLLLDPPLAAIDGEFTFTGGTGRFIGATGGGDASGIQNLATGDATVVLEGRISSVGASKQGF